MGLFWSYFLPRHSSFWSQPNTGWIPLSPNLLVSFLWSCCHLLPWIVVLFASKLFRLPAEQPVWDLLPGRLGFSRHWFMSPPITSHFPVFDWPALPRRTGKERGIMRWYVTHVGDKLSLSVATSQLMENPAEFSKKKNKKSSLTTSWNCLFPI